MRTHRPRVRLAGVIPLLLLVKYGPIRLAGIKGETESREILDEIGMFVKDLLKCPIDECGRFVLPSGGDQYECRYHGEMFVRVCGVLDEDRKRRCSEYAIWQPEQSAYVCKVRHKIRECEQDRSEFAYAVEHPDGEKYDCETEGHRLP